MKVAMVSEHASPLAVLGGVDAGGQNVYVAALAQQLGQDGVDVVVHTRRDDPAPARQVEMGPNVIVDHVDAGPAQPISKDDLLPLMNDFAVDLHRAWTIDRPDVVHAHFWMSGRAALAAARPLGIPVVVTFHALGVVKRRHQGSKDTSPPERLATEQTLVRRADRVMATCSDEVFELLRLGADSGALSVVPCGVDVDLFRPDVEPEPRTPGLRRLVVVSRLVERKGIGNVISALRDVRDAELVIAGGPQLDRLSDDPEAQRLMHLAREARVADRVQFRGRVGRSELPALMRSADVAVCVPWYEPFGIVPLEAMACGVPVVASAVGGLTDTVVDGVTGLHVPPRRPDRVADAVNLLLADADLRASLGAAGARRARSRYSWPRVAHATLGVYREVLASSARTSQAVMQ